jgi:diguanylate cyclase (GGDEF)-like protein
MEIRRLVMHAVPGALLLALAVGFAHFAPALDSAEPALLNAIEALLGVLAVLGVVFRRLRVLEAALLLAGGVWAIRAFPISPEDRGLGHFVHDATGLVLPLGLAWISTQKERNALSEAGLWRVLVLGAPVGLAAYVWVSFKEGVITLLATPLPSSLRAASSLSGPAAAAFGLAALVVVIRALGVRGSIEVGLCWALVAAWLCLDAAATTPAALVYLGAAGAILAVAVVQALFAMAFLDPLTGLPARRAFDEALAGVGSSFCVAMVDIDHFKACNDTHGHDVGDQVLRMVASRLRSVGGGGKVFRFGGEEFVVLFPGLDCGQARTHVEALRLTVAENPFIFRDSDRPAKKPETPRAARASRGTLEVTVSAGVAAHAAGQSPQDTLRAADAALYRAKSAGRNRVMTG